MIIYKYMKIAIINDNLEGLFKEDNFWSVLRENLVGSYGISLISLEGNIDDIIRNDRPDVLIVNSILRDIKSPPETKKIILLQDNFILMDKIVPKTPRQKIGSIIKGKRSFYKQKIENQKKWISRADKIIAVSKHVADTYKVNAEIIPIGTDSELFCPKKNRDELKDKHGIPKNKIVKIFVGSTHAVKGFNILLKEIKQDKNSFYIIVLKDEKVPNLNQKNVKIFQRIPQDVLVELYNCADLYVGRSRVETLWLTPIEAMFCGVPVDVTLAGIFADWSPENKNPRQEAFDKGLDRETMVNRWIELVSK